MRFTDSKQRSEVFEFPVNFFLLQVLLEITGRFEILQVGRIKKLAVSLFTSVLPADPWPLAVTAAPAIFIKALTGRVKFNVPLFPVIKKDIDIFVKKIPPYMVNTGLGVRPVYFDCHIPAAFAAAFFAGRDIFIICHNLWKFFNCISVNYKKFLTCHFSSN